MRLKLADRIFTDVTLLVLALILMPPAFSQEKQISWVISDWPPVYLLQDGKTPETPEQLGKGRTDLVLKQLIPNLPGYQHHFIQENIMRTWSGIATGQHQCDPASLRNPAREKLAYFTPVGLGMSVGVVVRNDQLGKLALGGSTVSLAHLVVDRRDLTGYVDAGRSFGPTIDAILNGDQVKLARQVESHNGHLLHMLDSARMDYTLENPIVVEYMTRHGDFAHALTVIPIEEVPPVVTVYAACPRNAWGLQAINAIAQAVYTAAQNNSYRESYINWLPTGLAATYRSQYDSFFDNLKKKPEPIK